MIRLRGYGSCARLTLPDISAWKESLVTSTSTTWVTCQSQECSTSQQYEVFSELKDSKIHSPLDTYTIGQVRSSQSLGVDVVYEARVEERNDDRISETSYLNAMNVPADPWTLPILNCFESLCCY